MFRRYLLLSVGVTALLVVLGAPGQLQAQHMRGGGSVMIQPSFRGGFMPGFNHGFSNPHFNQGFNPGFNRGFGDSRFNHGSPELRLFPTVPRGMASLFNPTMPGFVAPRLNPTMPRGMAPLFNPTMPSIFVP